MSNLLHPATTGLPRCSACGAEVPPGAHYCWLCGAKQVEILATAVPDEPPALDPRQRLLVWLAVVVVAVIGFGVLQSQDPVIAAMYLIAVVPTLLVVLFGTGLARARGQPWSPGKTVAVAATTAATTVLTAVVIAIITAAVAVLVVVAAVIALFAACLQAAGGGH
jgi:peptidoglycan/LPS O-acetylase OafA/YrhL